MDLKKLGWNDFIENHSRNYKDNNILVGRICSEYKNSYKIFSENGELTAHISGRFRNNCKSLQDYPAVGDWVTFDLIQDEDKAIIQSVLPRKSKFSRKVAGNNTQEQIIAANIDTAFIVCALNYDFSLRRIERYLSLVWQSGANPVIILTKTDLCADLADKLTEVQSIAFGIDIHSINNLTNDGIEGLYQHCKQGNTIVLLGSSGAGKTSLINNLLGEDKLKVQNLRKNIDKGRHTTTHRQMFFLTQGGLIIDTPGMRELQLWDAEEGVSSCFDDIETLAKNCRFNNCKHQNEPDCVVKEALENGNLDVKRFENYIKMQKELAYLSRKQNQYEAQHEKEKWKKISKQIKKLY